jgi:TP901-1 family phage major tail protein
MAAQKGKLFVIKIGDGEEPEVFTTLAGVRNLSLTINGEVIDVTTKDDASWRTLLEGNGIKTASMSVEGIVKDTATETLLRSKINEAWNYETVYPNGDKYAGTWVLTSFTDTGGHNDALTFSAQFENASALTFTAAA